MHMNAGIRLMYFLVLFVITSGITPPRCRLPTNQGPCDSTLTRWGFNKDTYSCETFIYGGCGGTGNNFLSRRDCLIHCNGGKLSE
uniref:BPTI/Kunitz inhibitor domain-containing protein n=1 Tax=Magallana gigas TaxID=29159 RepID=A0A8W8P457_MAGGI